MASDGIVLQWIGIAYSWLFLESVSNLRKPTKEIVSKMTSAVDSKNFAEAEQYMERLRKFKQPLFSQTGASRDYSYEPAEILVECGISAYRMGEKLTATQLFDEAQKKYIGQEHCRGAVLWMLGAVQWQFPTRVDDAIISWESSYEIYSLLRTRSNRVENAAWYRYWVEEMRVALDKAILKEYQAPPPKDEWPRWDNLSKQPNKDIEKQDILNSTPNQTFIEVDKNPRAESDRPSGTDRLNYSKYAQSFVRIILNPETK